MPTRRRTTKAPEPKRLSFAMTIVIVVLSSSASVAVSIYFFDFGQRSEMQQIRMSLEVQSKLQEERSAQMKDAIASMQRRQELQQYEIQGLKEVVMKLQPQGRD